MDLPLKNQPGIWTGRPNRLDDESKQKCITGAVCNQDHMKSHNEHLIGKSRIIQHFIYLNYGPSVPVHGLSSYGWTHIIWHPFPSWEVNTRLADGMGTALNLWPRIDGLYRYGGHSYTRTGRLMLRGLFHQKMYIMKFMAAYASIMISRWVIWRCSMAHAIHCIMNQDV